MDCKNCGKPIQRTNWSNGPGWTHVNGDSLCRHLHARPATEDTPEEGMTCADSSHQG